MRSVNLQSRLALCLVLAAAVAAAAQADDTVLKGDPDHGKLLYGACMGCHSLDDNDVGPRHRGVVGRKAASVPDYAYSAALKASGIKMFFSIPDAQSRADLIAYLATQK
jgi:cytochrome c